jgi:hypothetical protein
MFLADASCRRLQTDNLLLLHDRVWKVQLPSLFFLKKKVCNYMHKASQCTIHCVIYALDRDKISVKQETRSDNMHSNVVLSFRFTYTIATLVQAH